MMLAGSHFCLGNIHKRFHILCFLAGCLSLLFCLVLDGIWVVKLCVRVRKIKRVAEAWQESLAEGCSAVKLVHQLRWVPLVEKWSCLMTYFYESN